MELRPLQFDAKVMAHYCALFAVCFPGNSKFTLAYLHWLYQANPDGHAVGFDAWDGERLAAHYVCVPARALVNGAEVSVLLSLNTATHPDYQGRGLFTQLAARCYTAGAEQGFDGVYGVANANSTPGFVRKLGFQLVRPLEARLGFGSLGKGDAGTSLAFRRSWNSASLAWRCANPNNPVRSCEDGSRLVFHAPSLSSLVPVYAELPAAGLQRPASAGAAPMPLRLYLGLMPDQHRNFRSYVSIPQRFRPSPLNLIYRSFSTRVTTLDPAAISFTFLDFDAY